MEFDSAPPPKKDNSWVKHCGAWAKQHNCNYVVAVSSPDCRAAYYENRKMAVPSKPAAKDMRLSATHPDEGVEEAKLAHRKGGKRLASAAAQKKTIEEITSASEVEEVKAPKAKRARKNSKGPASE